jgi:hypothetical protein
MLKHNKNRAKISKQSFKEVFFIVILNFKIIPLFENSNTQTNY